MKSVRLLLKIWKSVFYPKHFIQILYKMLPFYIHCKMCTGFVEIIGVIQNVYLVLAVVLLQDKWMPSLQNETL